MVLGDGAELLGGSAQGLKARRGGEGANGGGADAARAFGGESGDGGSDEARRRVEQADGTGEERCGDNRRTAKRVVQRACAGTRRGGVLQRRSRGKEEKGLRSAVT